MAELARMSAVAGGVKKRGGGDWSLDDFCRWGAPPEPETLTDDQVLSLFGAFATPRNP